MESASSDLQWRDMVLQWSPTNEAPDQGRMPLAVKWPAPPYACLAQKGIRALDASCEQGFGVCVSTITLSNCICFFLMCGLLRRHSFLKRAQWTKYAWAKLEQEHFAIRFNVNIECKSCDKQRGGFPEGLASEQTGEVLEAAGTGREMWALESDGPWFKFFVFINLEQLLTFSKPWIPCL